MQRQHIESKYWRFQHRHLVPFRRENIDLTKRDERWHNEANRDAELQTEMIENEEWMVCADENDVSTNNETAVKGMHLSLPDTSVLLGGSLC